MAPVGARPEVPAPACQRFNAPGHPTSAPPCRRDRDVHWRAGSGSSV